MNYDYGKYIALFDSGFGGISVLNRLKKLMPYENYVYYADSNNFPYGKKSKTELVKIGKRIISRFVKDNAKMIVIACNTMSTSDMTQFESSFPNIKIIGTFPSFTHIFKPNLVLSERNIIIDKENKLTITNNTKKLLIIATTSTCKSDFLTDLVNASSEFLDIYVEPADFIVKAVENGNLDSFEFKNELRTFFKEYMDIDYLILGCTHFPFAIHKIREVLGDKVNITSSSEISANKCFEYLSQHNTITKNPSPYIRIVDRNIDDDKKDIYRKLIHDNNGYNIEFSKIIKS